MRVIDEYWEQHILDRVFYPYSVSFLLSSICNYTCQRNGEQSFGDDAYEWTQKHAYYITHHIHFTFYTSSIHILCSKNPTARSPSSFLDQIINLAMVNYHYDIHRLLDVAFYRALRVIN